jgi:DMSO/TMAO reductase YedYZ molybdopterin-dependent catalytic subunit
VKASRSVIALIFVIATTAVAQQQALVPEAALVVRTIAGQSLKMGPADFAKLPPAHVTATDHDGKKHEYDGVNLRDLLTQAGVAMGDNLRGKELADYVVAEASDGYRVVFSIAELDPGFSNVQVIVATRVDGQPLPAQVGPLRLVVPGDKRPARWVRMLTTISVVRAQ